MGFRKYCQNVWLFVMFGLVGERVMSVEKLETLNLAWCARVSSDIIPFALEASVRKKLRTIVLSDTNAFLSHIHALQRCLTEPLPKTLTLVGGLRRKETYEDVFEQQLDFLQRMNVKYQQFPEEYVCTQSKILKKFHDWFRSSSNRQCRERINQLKESKKILDSAILKSEGSEKVYVLCRTDRGAFGIKIRPSDFLELPRVWVEFLCCHVTFCLIQTDLISWLRRKSPEDLLEYLCRLVENFDWLHMFQGYHTLSHVGVWDCTNRNGNGDLWVENAAGWCKRVATEMDCDEPEEVNAIFPQQIEWEWSRISVEPKVALGRTVGSYLASFFLFRSVLIYFIFFSFKRWGVCGAFSCRRQLSRFLSKGHNFRHFKLFPKHWFNCSRQLTQQTVIYHLLQLYLDLKVTPKTLLTSDRTGDLNVDFLMCSQFHGFTWGTKL